MDDVLLWGFLIILMFVAIGWLVWLCWFLVIGVRRYNDEMLARHGLTRESPEVQAFMNWNNPVQRQPDNSWEGFE